MKRLLALLLCVVLVLSLTACGNKEDDGPAGAGNDTTTTRERDDDDRDDARSEPEPPVDDPRDAEGDDSRLSDGGAGRSASDRRQATAKLDPDTPVGSYARFMDAYIDLDFIEAKLYARNFNSNDASDSADLSDLDDDGALFLRALISTIDYQILSDRQISDDEAVIEVEITSISGAAVIGDIVKELLTFAMQAAMRGDDVSEEMIERFMIDMLTEKMEDPDTSFETNRVSVVMVKDGGRWLVDFEDGENLALLNALTGNFLSAMEGLAEQFGDFM